MSTEFKPKDRVSINKDLPYTTPRFSAVKEMRTILTGTITHVYNGDGEATVMLDYPDDVPEGKRISYSYDTRDLTLIPKTEKKGKPMSKFKGDRVYIDKSLKFTEKRFGLTSEMRSIFTGVIDLVDEEGNKAIVQLDGEGSHMSWTYDLRDLTLIPNNDFPTPTNVKTSNNKTTVEFSDNTTTSVTKSAGDPYDLETAIAYCIAKKLVTNSCIKHLAKNAEEVIDKVDVEFYNKFLKPYGFLNENAYTDVEIETLKNYLKTLNDVRSEMALIAIENNLSKDELFNKLKG
jgi:hypothetical protein